MTSTVTGAWRTPNLIVHNLTPPFRYWLGFVSQRISTGIPWIDSAIFSFEDVAVACHGYVGESRRALKPTERRIHLSAAKTLRDMPTFTGIILSSTLT